MLQEKHSAAFERYKGAIQPLPGARELLRQLSDAGVAYAIATSGRREGAQPAMDKLEVRPEVPIITRNEVERAKPDPDLFLAAAQRVNIPISHAMVVGDSVWDLLARPESRLSRDWAAFRRVWKRGVATSRSL